MNTTSNLVAVMKNDLTIRRATKYVTPSFTVKLTRQRRPDRRSRSETFLLTRGRPNFAEREFIKKCVKVGEGFPVKKIQLTYFPKRGAKR